MTDRRFVPPPPPPAVPPGWRALLPGGGNQVRRAYSIFLAVSAPAALITLGITVFLTVRGITGPQAPVTLTGCLTLAGSWTCAIVALLGGRRAVHGDAVSVPGVVKSRTLARVGGLIGWLGAVAVAVIVVLQYVRGADDILEGGVVTAMCLIPAVCNDNLHRIARRLLHP